MLGPQTDTVQKNAFPYHNATQIFLSNVALNRYGNYNNVAEWVMKQNTKQVGQAQLKNAAKTEWNKYIKKDNSTGDVGDETIFKSIHSLTLAIGAGVFINWDIGAKLLPDWARKFGIYAIKNFIIRNRQVYGDKIYRATTTRLHKIMRKRRLPVPRLTVLTTTSQHESEVTRKVMHEYISHLPKPIQTSILDRTMIKQVSLSKAVRFAKHAISKEKQIDSAEIDITAIP